MCNIPANVASFSIGNDSGSIIPYVNRLVGEIHKRPWIGPRRNRGFQDDNEEVSENDGESEGSEGPLPSRGGSEVIAGGWPTFVRFSSSRLAAPIALACSMSLGAVGCMSGSSLSEPIADARRAGILTASSACRSR